MKRRLLGGSSPSATDFLAVILVAFAGAVGASTPVQAEELLLGIQVSGVPAGGVVEGSPGSVLQLDVLSFVETDSDCIESAHLNLFGEGPLLGFAADDFDVAAAQALMGHTLDFFSLSELNGLCITPDHCVPALVSYGAILQTVGADKEVLEPGRTNLLKLRLDIRVPEDPGGELVILQFGDWTSLQAGEWNDFGGSIPRPQRTHLGCEGTSLLPEADPYSFRVLPFQKSRPGDASGDGNLDISDPLALLSWLFIEPPSPPPCQGGLGDPASVRLLDANGDGLADITDAIHLLFQLFLGGAPHVLGSECIPIAGCRPSCS